MFFKTEINEKEFSSLGKGKAKMIKVSNKEIKVGSKLDAQRTALPAGKRMSKYGKIYYESRSNRSD